MALSATGKVVGVSLNGSHEPGHLEEMQENADNCPNPRFRKILQLLVDVERGSDVFSKFSDVDRLFEVRILSVDSAVRGRGIAKALLEKSRSAKGKVCLHVVPSCRPLSLAYSLFFRSYIHFSFLCRSSRPFSPPTLCDVSPTSFVLSSILCFSFLPRAATLTGW
jgi:predicted GNAT family acetyltransferase